MSFAITSKNKLLFVIPSLCGGGAERVALHIINHLDKDKYNIRLVIFERILDYKKDLFSPVRIICLDKKSRWDFFKLILKLRRVIKDFKPDTIISLLHYTNIIAVLSCLWLVNKPRVIVCEHSYHRKYLPLTRVRRLRKLLMKFTYGKTDMIIAISERMRESMIVDFNLNSDKIIVIYNPIPLEIIRNLANEEIQNDFFNGKSGQIIITVGRLTQLKRFDRLIKAFALLRQEKEVYLLILGQGELLNELKDLSRKLTVNEYIRFIGFKDNPFTWISKSDLFILSSDFEGFPMVILEAMACGTPVISTDCPSGPGEIITNGKNGILVPPADEEALAEAMLTLLKNENLRKKFSQEGRRRAEDFRIEKILPQYEKLF